MIQTTLEFYQQMLILINDSFPAERMMQVGRYWRNNNTKARRLWVRGGGGSYWAQGWWTICPPPPPTRGVDTRNQLWPPVANLAEAADLHNSPFTSAQLQNPPLSQKIHLCHKKSTFVTKIHLCHKNLTSNPRSQSSQLPPNRRCCTTLNQVHNRVKEFTIRRRNHLKKLRNAHIHVRTNHNHLEHHHLTGMNPISG